MLAHPRTAVRGNQLGALGMLLAIVATLMSGTWDWTYIILGIGIGSVIGAMAALRVKMTSMPELVGLFNGFGGAASVLVAGSALVATFNAVSAGAVDRQHADEGRHRAVRRHRFGDVLRFLRRLRQASRVPVRQMEAPHLAEDRQVRLLAGRRRRWHLVWHDHGDQPPVDHLHGRRWLSSARCC